jgi:hypothetical protein
MSYLESRQNAWSEPQIIESFIPSFPAHTATMDNNGTVTLVWKKVEGDQNYLWVKQYNFFEKLWSDAVRLSNTPIGEYDFPVIASNENGDLVVAWSFESTATENANDILLMKKASNDAAWSGTLISSSFDEYKPSVDINTSGDIMIAYQSYQAFKHELRTALIKHDSGTVDVFRVDNLSDSIEFNPYLSLDNDGNAMVIWGESSASSQALLANRYSSSTNTWNTPVMISSSSVSVPVYFDERSLQSDYLNNYYVLWYDDNKTIWYNRFSNSTKSWNLAKLVQTDISKLSDRVKFVVLNNGNLMAIWRQEEAGNTKIMASMHSAEQDQWTPTYQIDNRTSGYNVNPIGITKDMNDNLLVVFHQDNGTSKTLWSTRYISQQ